MSRTISILCVTLPHGDLAVTHSAPFEARRWPNNHHKGQTLVKVCQEMTAGGIKGRFIPFEEAEAEAGPDKCGPGLICHVPECLRPGDTVWIIDHYADINRVAVCTVDKIGYLGPAEGLGIGLTQRQKFEVKTQSPVMTKSRF